MPLTDKGREILAAMKRQYGEKKGEEVFYASRNKGTIRGVDAEPDRPYGNPVTGGTPAMNNTMPPVVAAPPREIPPGTSVPVGDSLEAIQARNRAFWQRRR